MVAPLERRLHSVSFDGGAVATLTPERGVHAISLSRDAKTFVDEHSARDRLPRAVVRRVTMGGDPPSPPPQAIEGGDLGELPVPTGPDVERLALRSPEIVEVKSAGGQTLYGALLKPRHLEPGRRYPVVVMVYGGPGVQTVLDAWAPRLLWQHLADRGFVVFQLDNPRSPGRGPGFPAHIYRKLCAAAPAPP